MSSQKWLSWSGLEPRIIFLKYWMQWLMTDSKHTPKFIIVYYYVVIIDKSLVHIAQLDLYQSTKRINMFRVGTPQPFIFKNWTQWCMAGLNLTPHFKYSTIQYLKNSDIIILDRPTRNRSFHQKDQHVKGWNPTIILKIFFENKKG